MKNLVFFLFGLFTFSAINAQSLDEIVKKYTDANKFAQTSHLKTIKMTATMAMMGMEIPIDLWMKSPNKIKSVSTINGMEIISVFDGQKGYLVNPMAGSSQPVEMTSDKVTETLRSSLFQNYIANYLKNGQLTLDGEEKINDKPAYKLKATLEGGTNLNLFIDKASFLLVKISTATVDSFPSQYTETNGVFLPMKNTGSTNGMEFTVTYSNVEADLPMDDSIFKVN